MEHKIQLFNKNGYVNIPQIMYHPATFIFIYGGRGTGKTYGTLQHFIRSKTKFIYLRRLQSQVDLVKRDDMQPFKTLNRDNKWNIQPYPVNKYVSAFFEFTK